MQYNNYNHNNNFQEPPPQTTGESVFCTCGSAAALRQSNKENENKGRYFYTCAKGDKFGGCKFFRWQDQQPIKVQFEENNRSDAEQMSLILLKSKIEENENEINIIHKKIDEMYQILLDVAKATVPQKQEFISANEYANQIKKRKY